MQSYYESYRDNMRQPHAWYDRRNICLPHFHAGIELSYVLEGRFNATVNGRTYTVHAGEILINNCYSVHAYTTSEKCHAIVAIIPLGVVPSIQKKLTSNRFRSPVVADDEGHSLEFLMRMLADHSDNATLQKGVSYSLLGLLAEKTPLDPMDSSDQADVICRILSYLNDNYTQRLTVEQVATHFGYSRSRFSHLFKSTVGYSLPQYLNLLRCRSICDALLTTDTPIVDLAVSAGFNNTHTFYSAFKTYYHMTPREYIRRQKSGKNE